MYKTRILNRLEQSKFLVIARVDTFTRAQEIIEGILKGGIDCVEISYTNNNAGQIIQQLNEQYGEKILVGAGTVLDSETARLAILAGAKFIIAPNYSDAVCKICNRYQIPYMPGCTTMTEIVTALENGADMIKAFPISNYYGHSLVNVIKTPMPFVPLMSSGAVTLENIDDWLKSDIECIGVGSLLTKGTVEEISKNALSLSNALKRHRQQ